MPREIIPEREKIKGPPEVFVTLRDLIALQHDAHGFSFLPKHAIQSLLSGRHRSRLRGRGLDFDEVRKYVAGDDIRNIDWRVTARMGKPHSKVFTEERERPVLLVTDQSSSMFFGSQVYLKSVIAAHFTSLSAWRTLEVGDRVGGIVFDDQNMDYVTPKRDRRSVQRLLHLVASRNQTLDNRKPEPDSKQLNRALRQTQQLVTHDFLVVLISDFMDFDRESMKLMKELSRHNDLIAAQVIDSMEERLPDVDLVLSDGRFQTAMKQHHKARTRLDQNIGSKQEMMVSQFKRFGVPLLKFNTSDPASTQLRNMVGGEAQSKRIRKRV